MAHEHQASAAPPTRRRRARVSRAEHDVETLLRETHHRVKADLQVVASLLSIQADAATDPSVKEALRDAESRILAIALIHAQLSEVPVRAATIEMGAFIRDLARHVQQAFANPAKSVSISLDLDEVRLPVRLAIPCGLVVGELLTNAYRHAFDAVRTGAVGIRISEEERSVIVIVRDNGPGKRPHTGKTADGLGMELVHLLTTKQLRGKVSVARGQGTTIRVTFPVADPRK